MTAETDRDDVTHARFRLSHTNYDRYADGWILVRLRCQASGELAVDVRLVCTFDDIGRDVTTYQLPVAANGELAAVLHIRGGAKRWDLHTRASSNDVAVSSFTAVELTHAEGAVRTTLKLASERRWKPRDSLRLAGKAMRILRKEGVGPLLNRLRGDGVAGPDPVTYARWMLAHEPRADRDLEPIKQRIKALNARPLFSVVMPVYNTPAAWLDRAIQSVRDQFWQEWELCIADDASTSSETREVLDRHAAEDPRVRVVFRERNGHISEASNSALAIATGEYVALLDHDDELSPHALYVMAEYIQKSPDGVLFYSDEDKVDETGRRYDPYFKCDWNPELFTSQNFVSHLGVYRRSDLTRVNGFRKGFEGSQDYDLVLRVTEGLRSDQIVHVPHILYHWRAIPGSTALDIDEKSYAVVRAQKALKEHFERRNIDVTIEPAWERAQFHRVRYALPTPSPSVSIIIGTRDRADLLKTAIDSIDRRTDYPNYEIVVIDNRSEEAGTAKYLAQLAQRPNVRILKFDEPFNFSAMNNFAARQSSADVYVLLNNDIEVITPGWLTELVSHAIRPEIGCVGAMLYYPDERVQHAGVVLGMNGVAGHAFRMLRRGGMGYFSRAAVVQSYSVVTAACLAIRRSVFWEVDGLDAELPVAFNDVDFCIRVRDRGYRNVWTPYAELYHYESATRGSDMVSGKRERFLRDTAFMQKRWGKALIEDPAYNPNLRLDDENFGLAAESRAPRPWRAGNRASAKPTTNDRSGKKRQSA